MTVSDIHIDTLNLRLPKGFEGRANSIARLAVSELAKNNISDSLEIKKLDLAKIQLNGSESNRMIARKISSAITRSLSPQQTESHKVNASNVNPKQAARGDTHVA